MTDLFTLATAVVPWHPSQWQVSKYGTRYYADTQPPCDLVAEPHAEPVPGFSSLKPSKPFRKSVTVGESKYTVPLDWHRAFVAWSELVELDLPHEAMVHRFYRAVNDQRDRDFARGHAIHAAAEAALVGQGVLNINADAEPYIPHLAKWITANVTAAYAVEAVVFGDGYGGTGDAWLMVRGTPCYVDWKSRGVDSAHGIYEEEIMQGGAYNSARYCIIPDGDGGAKRAPIPAAEYGMVLSIRPDGVQEFWYDLTGAKRSFGYLLAGYHSGKDGAKIARAAKVPAPDAPAKASKARKAVVAVETVNAADVAPPSIVKQPAWIQDAAGLTADATRDNLLRRCRKVAEMSPAGAEWLKTELVKRDLNVRQATVAEFPLIVEVLEQAETYVSAPFDPLPVPPVAPVVSDQDPVPTLDATPDDGPTVDDHDATFAEMRAAYGALGAAGKAWVGNIVTESIQAGRSLHMVDNRTLRRVRTTLGLALLAADELEDVLALRALVHLATSVDAVLIPSVPLGAAVSIMSAAEAEVFIGVVRLFLDGLLEASVDADGHVRLGVAA
jgi:hypothetical protein